MIENTNVQYTNTNTTHTHIRTHTCTLTYLHTNKFYPPLGKESRINIHIYHNQTLKGNT
jgi:hypothetical protein